ncbi:T9SS type A sorting domain-containing protein [bacterium AH-315-C20]|nr:T9SS type A sorting domain-containing protein [bacterium AH-315-C20]
MTHSPLLHRNQLVLICSLFLFGILLNNNCYSQAAFEEHLIPTTIEGNFYVDVADVDGDNDLDVLCGGSMNNIVAWYENDGSEGFIERIVTDSCFVFYSVTAVDLDGDSDIDLLTAAMNGTISWFQNDGSQNFTEFVISDTAVAAWFVFPKDLDEDGDIDVIGSSFGTDTLSWYENDGSENFIENVISTSTDGPNSFTVIDVDGDADYDIVLSSLLDDKVTWYENDGSENFTENVVSVTADGNNWVHATDLDGDGDVDLFSASFNDKEAVWYENDGSENFTEQLIANNASTCILTGDLDNDGDLDVITTSHSFDGTPDKIAWHENDGNEIFTEHILSTATNGAVGLHIEDLDEDGDLDILVAIDADDQIIWYENKLINVGLDETDMESFIYPNPTSGMLQVSSIPIDFEVLNSLGEVVVRKQSEKSVDLSSLPDGQYFIQIDGVNYPVVKR